jgi:flagellar protein FlaG
MFSLDEESGESVISVVDRQSSKVIRQIPNEVILTLAQKLNNEEPLLLFSAQV